MMQAKQFREEVGRYIVGHEFPRWEILLPTIPLQATLTSV
jgi:hypothetical protein